MKSRLGAFVSLLGSATAYPWSRRYIAYLANQEGDTQYSDLYERSLQQRSSSVFYDVQLALDLLYLNDEIAVQFEGEDPWQNAAVSHFCHAVHDQINGPQVLDAALTYGITVEAQKRSLPNTPRFDYDCHVSMPLRNYNKDAEDLIGPGYFTLKITVNQIIHVSTTAGSPLPDDTEILGAVESGFIRATGGRLSFRTRLIQDPSFSTILNVELNDSTIERVPHVPSEAPTPFPTTSSPTKSTEPPSPPPTVRPSVVPTSSPSLRRSTPPTSLSPTSMPTHSPTVRPTPMTSATSTTSAPSIYNVTWFPTTSPTSVSTEMATSMTVEPSSQDLTISPSIIPTPVSTAPPSLPWQSTTPSVISTQSPTTESGTSSPTRSKRDRVVLGIVGSVSMFIVSLFFIFCVYPFCPGVQKEDERSRPVAHSLSQLSSVRDAQSNKSHSTKPERGDVISKLDSRRDPSDGVGGIFRRGAGKGREADDNDGNRVDSFDESSLYTSITSASNIQPRRQTQTQYVGPIDVDEVDGTEYDESSYDPETYPFFRIVKDQDSKGNLISTFSDYDLFRKMASNIILSPDDFDATQESIFEQPVSLASSEVDDVSYELDPVRRDHEVSFDYLNHNKTDRRTPGSDDSVGSVVSTVSSHDIEEPVSQGQADVTSSGLSNHSKPPFANSVLLRNIIEDAKRRNAVRKFPSSQSLFSRKSAPPYVSFDDVRRPRESALIREERKDLRDISTAHQVSRSRIGSPGKGSSKSVGALPAAKPGTQDWAFKHFRNEVKPDDHLTFAQSGIPESQSSTSDIDEAVRRRLVGRKFSYQQSVASRKSDDTSWRANSEPDEKSQKSWPDIMSFRRKDLRFVKSEATSNGEEKKMDSPLSLFPGLLGISAKNSHREDLTNLAPNADDVFSNPWIVRVERQELRSFENASLGGASKNSFQSPPLSESMESRDTQANLDRFESELDLYLSHQTRSSDSVPLQNGEANIEAGPTLPRSLEQDLKFLEHKLSQVLRHDPDHYTVSSIATSSAGASTRSGRNSRRKRVVVVVPPGKLGVVLGNRHDGRGTTVTEVRESSSMHGLLNPGDKLVAVDGDDVTGMIVSEIISLMASRADQTRRLTVITTSEKHNQRQESKQEN